MQRIIHEYRNASRIFNMIEGLYTYVSDTEFMFEDVLWLDKSFSKVCDILTSKLSIFRIPELKSFALPQITLPSRKKEVIVCLSGGKDSAATALYYKKLGYTVHLYHMTGVNRAYGDEKSAAQNIAKYLDCDLHIDKLQYLGDNQFIEHPLKNYLIANGAIHYAIAKNYPPVIAFGNFNQSFLDVNEFEVCGGDCIEMWQAYEPIIQTVIPNFKMEIPLSTNADSFDILKDDWTMFTMSISCMSPYRFREHWRHRVENKYNVKILDNRCGCCWKCCVETMWLMDNNYMDYDEEYYLHCVGILIYTIWKESGIEVESVKDAWYNYMFYPIEESKAWKLLDGCTYKNLKTRAAIIVPASSGWIRGGE